MIREKFRSDRMRIRGGDCVGEENWSREVGGGESQSVVVVVRKGPHGGKKKVRGSGNFSLSATGQVGLHQGTLQWVSQMLDEANGFDFASSHTRNLTRV